MNYELKWEDDWHGHGPGWTALFEDGVHVFVMKDLTDDPDLTDQIIRDTYEDFVLGDAAPDARVYEVPRRRHDQRQ